MTGQQLYEKYLIAAEKAGPGTDAWDYFRELALAFLTVGDKLFKSLEEAEKSGKKIGIVYPIPFDEGPSEPSGIEIV
jgi:hypothetical protein